MQSREAALARIRRNIQVHGYHVYLVHGGPCPRFAYTIGLSDTCGAEIVLAGAAFYSGVEVKRVIDDWASRLLKNETSESIDHNGLGASFTRKVCPSWVRLLLLGATDFYGRQVSACQVFPEPSHSTVDVPDMSVEWYAVNEPVWQWLQLPWSFPVCEESVVMTNLDALQGYRVTEAARWEENQWEMFSGSGPDTPPEEVRAVPLGTLLGFDQSLEPAVRLQVGSAIWRDGEGGEWEEWRSSSKH